MKQAGKVIIIGAGHVGSHAAYALASQGLAGEIVLIDIDREKAAAQVLDIGDAVAYLPYPVKIKAGDYKDAGDGDVMVIAVGTNPDKAKGETRMDTLAATAAIIRDVAEEIRQSGFYGILVSISNPADVIAHYLQYLLSWPAGSDSSGILTNISCEFLQPPRHAAARSKIPKSTAVRFFPLPHMPAFLTCLSISIFPFLSLLLIYSEKVCCPSAFFTLIKRIADFSLR